MFIRQPFLSACGFVALVAFVGVGCTESETPATAGDAAAENAGGTGGTTAASGSVTAAGGAGANADAAGGAGGAGETSDADAAVVDDVQHDRVDGAADAADEDTASTPEDASDAGSPLLTICQRLTAPTSLSFDVAIAFEHNIYTDCRLKWLTRLYYDLDERAQFLNNLIAWNLEFWGCTGTLVTDTPFVYQPRPLSQSEADAVVEQYMNAANISLAMSPSEAQTMRAALRALVQASVDPTLEGFSRSVCADASAINEGGAPDATEASDESAVPPEGEDGGTEEQAAP